MADASISIGLGFGSPFTSWSQSSSGSSSWSWSGLSGGVKQPYLEGFLKPLLQYPHLVGGVFESALSGRPNENIWNNLVQNSFKNYQNQLYPAIQQNVRGVIENLANRGVLDSSVASNALSGLLGSYQQQLGDYLANLQKTALFYPLDVIRSLSIVPQAAGTARESESMSSSSSYSQSYNPAPAFSLISSLIGL